jgi:acyl carrier protein
VRADLASMTAKERVEAVTRLLVEQLAAVLTVPADMIDRDTSLPELGLDSLLAAEFRTRVNVALDVQVSALELNRGAVSSLASRLAAELAAPA